MRASFAPVPTRAQLARTFDNLDRGLSSKPSRDRLRVLAGHVVNELVEALPRPDTADATGAVEVGAEIAVEIDPGIAAFPKVRPRATTSERDTPITDTPGETP